METDKIFTSKSTMPQNIMSPPKPDLLKMKRKLLDGQTKFIGTDLTALKYFTHLQQNLLVQDWC